MLRSEPNRQGLIASATVAVLALTGASAPPSMAAASQGSPPPISAMVRSLPAAPGDVSRLLAPVRSELAGALARIGAVRSSIPRGSFVERVRSVLSAGGGSSVSVPRMDPPSWRQVTSVNRLPFPLRQPVAGLDAAVQQAISMLPKPTEAQLARGVRAVLSGFSHRSGPVVESRDPSAPGRVSRLRLGWESSLRSRHFSGVRTGGREDPQAALLIAAALDKYLPALEAARDRVPSRAGTAASGCDMLDRTPYLCVGSDADNTHEENQALLIDLGGGDTYSNSAGGAPFLPEGGAAYIPVSVNLDLSGDDTYVAGRMQANAFGDQLTLGQGAGLVGSLGFAVDLAGSDSYSAGAAPTPPGDQSTLIAQGAGVGATGLLFDLSGDDSYRATGVDGTNDVVFALAQGVGDACYLMGTTDPTQPTPVGAGCSMGALVDLGGGNDAYSIDASSTFATPEDFPVVSGVAPERVALGQGVGTFGFGILYDDGGKDAFSASASARRPGRLSYPLSGWAPEARVTAQGSGNGMLLEGSGDTTYQVHAEGVGTVIVNGAGQGVGAGILDDEGGDDAYVVNGSITFDPSIVIDDSCAADGQQPCASAKASVSGRRSAIGSTTARFGTMSVAGQGVGSFGLGLLFDHAGNDTYEATSTEQLDAVLHDQLSSPEAPPSLDVEGYSTASLYAQGVGVQAGAGVLWDQQGDDSYEARSVNETHASATSDHASGDPSVTALPGWLHSIGAQGATDFAAFNPQGALIDLGGDTDRFEVVAINPTTTAPDPAGAFQPGNWWPPVQGTGSGGLFVATGDDPQVISSPSSPACVGDRGYGTWAGCPLSIHTTDEGNDPDNASWDSQGDGVGFAPNATGSAPSLTLTSDTPTTAARDSEDHGQRYSDPPSPSFPRVPVGARLKGPDGQPLAGAVVHFDLQMFCRACYLLSGFYAVWLNFWQADAVTDSDGVARASLPLWGTGSFWDTSADYRIAATYDGQQGDPGVYPAHAAQPLALT